MNQYRHPANDPTNSLYRAYRPTGTEAEPYFAGYVHGPAISPDEELIVGVATRSDANCCMDVYRVVGVQDPFLRPRLAHVDRFDAISSVRYPKRNAGAILGSFDADVLGCQWPAERVGRVGSDWASGLYLAQFTSAPSPTGMPSERLGQDALFIVRGDPARPVRLLVQVGVATWAAYHLWVNRSLYVGHDDDGVPHSSLRSGQVSLLRPGIGLGAPNGAWRTPAPFKASYTMAMIDFLEAEGYQYDVCAGLEIGTPRQALDTYETVVTVGHDEYWTQAQRSALATFRGSGGNTVFLGGNLGYWRTRWSPEQHSVECAKRHDHGAYLINVDAEPADHVFPAGEEVTTEFFTDPHASHAANLTGAENARLVGGRAVTAGAMWWWEEHGGPVRPHRGFVIREADNWTLAGTGLGEGDEFGAQRRLIGHEADGLPPEDFDRIAELANLEVATVVCQADCRDWGELDFCSAPPKRIEDDAVPLASLGGYALMIEGTSKMGGMLFTAGTTEWCFGLVPCLDFAAVYDTNPVVNPPDPVVIRITTNVLNRLAQDRAEAASD